MTFQRHIRFILFVTALILSVTGCEKIIHLKTDTIPDKYVIEANLSNQRGECTVILTKTVKLDGGTIFPLVPGAMVAISDNGRAPVPLIEVDQGKFFSNDIHAVPGHTYTLQVKINNQLFTSSVTAPEKVTFDSLYVEDFSAFGQVRKFAHVVFQDPVGKGDAYRFLQYKNGIQNSNIFVMNDEYSDGRLINTFLAYFDQSDDQRLFPGDTVLVKMQSISPAIYKFFYSLSQSSTGGSEVISPGNPVTNITGGALGYFNVFMGEEKSIIVPQ